VGRAVHLGQVRLASGTRRERDEAHAGLEARLTAQLESVPKAEDRRLADVFFTSWVLSLPPPDVTHLLGDHDHQAMGGASRQLAG